MRIYKDLGVFVNLLSPFRGKSLYFTLMTQKHAPLLILLSLTLASCQMSEAGTKIVEQSKTIAGQVSGSIGSSGSDIGVMLGKTFGWESSALTNQDISAAFKQALSIGTDQVVGQLGQTNGFLLDPKVKIPLPDKLSQAQDLLQKVGMSHLMDDLENRLNRAAEIATPHAKELFLNAISDMSFTDVMNIYSGPPNSATKFFEAKMSNALADKMSPFVNDAVAQAGVIQSYDQLISRYNDIPFASALAPDIKGDLTSYVVDKGIDGIFLYLGEQEKEIRQDPVRHTTELLKKVFGNKT